MVRAKKQLCKQKVAVLKSAEDHNSKFIEELAVNESSGTKRTRSPSQPPEEAAKQKGGRRHRSGSKTIEANSNKNPSASPSPGPSRTQKEKKRGKIQDRSPIPSRSRSSLRQQDGANKRNGPAIPPPEPLAMPQEECFRRETYDREHGAGDLRGQDPPPPPPPGQVTQDEFARRLAYDREHGRGNLGTTNPPPPPSPVMPQDEFARRLAYDREHGRSNLGTTNPPPPPPPVMPQDEFARRLAYDREHGRSNLGTTNPPPPPQLVMPQDEFARRLSYDREHGRGELRGHDPPPPPPPGQVMQDEFAGRSACDREHGRDFGATNPPPPPQRSRSSSPELPNPSPSTIPEPAAPPKPRRKTAKKNYAASQVDMFLSSESSEDEEVNLDPSADCSSCNWKTKYLKLAAGHDKLKKKLNSTKVQRNRLMQSLTSDLLNEPKTFTTEEGFPPIVQLQAMANTTRKPYCFVRTLMQEIWPRGFGNKTVTGNPSKNCLGRPSRSSKSASRQSPREVDGALEANKVKYLRDRLVEFLTLQGTDVATAADIVYSQSGKWFSQIICLYNKKGKW